MQKRWFASLSRGIGWKPATWQGWSITTLYLILVVSDFFWVKSYTTLVSELWFNFIVQFLILTIILSFICYFTGEKPRI